MLDRLGNLVQQVDVRFHPRPVRGYLLGEQRLRAGRGGRAVCRPAVGRHLRGRVERHRARGPVDQELAAGAHAPHQLRDLCDHRDAQAARQDGGVALRPAALDHHGSQAVEIHGKEVHDRRLMRHQHQGNPRSAARHRVRLQVPEDPAEDILEIVEALLQQRGAQLLKGRQVAVQHLDQGALGRPARGEHIGQVVLDGAVLHQHELCLEDRAVVLADQGGNALAEQGDLLAGRPHGRAQPPRFADGVRAGQRDGVPPGVEAVADIRLSQAGPWAQPRAA